MLDTNYAFCYYSSCRLHGACSSAVESQIVDLVVVGSKPTRHPEKAERQADGTDEYRVRSSTG